MKPFTGFSTDRQKTVRVPEGFFEDVLPSITSMLEMKITLYLFWRLARGGQSSVSPRMAAWCELVEDAGLRAAVSQTKGPRAHADALREGLELAVARGTLLQIFVREEESSGQEAALNGPGKDQAKEIVPSAAWYMLNTRESRAWIEALGNGEIDISQTPLAEITSHNGHSDNGANSNGHNSMPLRVIIERPSVYALYEQNIGLLTPILAERLQEAEGRYPAEWIESAFEEAVTNNKRNWRYIERILERWAAEGKASGKNGGPAERSLDPDKYTKGKYAFLFRPEGH